MNIGIFSYQAAHIKTWSLIHKLKRNGHKITIFALPFIAKPIKRPIVEDRPYPILPYSNGELCKYFGVREVRQNGWQITDRKILDEEYDSQDFFITCISKIIPWHFIENKIILNAHPGLLPLNRGIDSFKRSIINLWPIGVTVHAIDQSIDAGKIICRSRVPIYPNDDIKKVAQRSFELEVELLAESPARLKYLNNNWCIDTDKNPLSRANITPQEEASLEDTFKKNIIKFMKMSGSKNDTYILRT